MTRRTQIETEIQSITRADHDRIVRGVRDTLENEWQAMPSEKRQLLEKKYGSKQRFMRRIGEWVALRVISDKVADALNIDVKTILSSLGLGAATPEMIEGGLTNYIQSMTAEQRELFAPLIENVEKIMGGDMTTGAALEAEGLFDYAVSMTPEQEELFGPLVENAVQFISGDVITDVADEGGDSLIEWLTEMLAMS